MSLYRSVLPASRQIRTLGGVFYYNTRSHSMYSKEPYKQKPFSLKQQSVLLPGPGRIRSCVFLEDPNVPVGSIPGSPEVKTVYDVLAHGMKVSNDGPCIGNKVPGTKEYKWESYSKVISRSQHVGSGLIELGLAPKNDTFIGIFATNQEEFLLSLYGCAAYSMVLVPLYLTLGLKSVLYIINHSKLPVVVTSNHHNTMTILTNAAQLPTVKTLVMCQTPTPEQIKLAEAAKIKVITFAEMEELGKLNKKELVLPDPDDIFCIPFTSGTTGTPKGVMMTHGNLISCVASLVIGYGEAGLFGGTILSYLPTAHIYEVCNEVASLYFARGVAFYSGEIKDLMNEVRCLKPSILPLVPRLMGTIYMEALMKVKQSKIKSTLLPFALWYKERLLKRGKVTRNTIWDKYIFKDFQESIGDETHMVTVTSAPVPPDILRFFILASGCYVYEVYGSTEVLSAIITLPFAMHKGHVGGPTASNFVKLVDVPDMGYFSKDDAGEICVKGKNVFKGYLSNPEATNDALKDGWYHSGDIGRWLPNGALKIIDRKKHLFKLSQGEYIIPEKIENAYCFSNLVLQILVDGIPEKDYPIALIVPEPVALKKWLASKGYSGIEKLSDFLSRKETRRDFLTELHKKGQEKDLNSLEQARNLAFLLEPFTIDNDMLTPTLKVKRNVARKHYQSLFQKLYEEGPLVDSLKS